MSDDAIPTMAAQATGDEGVGTKHIKFKEKVMHTITRSTDHIDEIKKHTAGVKSIKNRASTFQRMHDAQSPNLKERPKSSPRTPKSGGKASTGGGSIEDIMRERRKSVDNNSSVFEGVGTAARGETVAPTSPVPTSPAPAPAPAEEKAAEEMSKVTIAEPAEKEEESPKAEEAATEGETEIETETAATEEETKGGEDDEEKKEEEQKVEGEEEAEERPTTIRRESVAVKKLHECPYTFPFDKNGAVHWIGSEGGVKEYENPQLTGELYLEISTLYRGKLDNLTSYTTPTNSAERIAAATYTNNSSRSWLVVDFGPERALRPSYYAIKHGASGIGNAIRNWVLEAQVDEYSPWVTLRTHENDTTMREEPQSVAGFELTSEKARSAFYRVFRITQIGKNSGGNDCLFIGGIEFYGIMKVQTMTEIEVDESQA